MAGDGTVALPADRKADEQGGRLAEGSAEASLLSATLKWANCDPCDRFIAATAITWGADTDVSR